MTLETQKAKSRRNRKQQKKGRGKGAVSPPQQTAKANGPLQPESREPRIRRVAQEFAVRWSEEARQSVEGRPSGYIRRVMTAAYARACACERMLCDAVIVPIGPVDPLLVFDSWWLPFDVDDLTFVVKYNDGFIRDYEIRPWDGRAPIPQDPPNVVRRQRTPPPTQIGPRPRKKREPIGKRGRPTAKHSASFAAEQIIARAARSARNASYFILDGADLFSHKLEQLRRRFRPRLLRSLAQSRRVSGVWLRSGQACVAPVVQLVRQWRRSVTEVGNSLTGRGASGTGHETFALTAYLEPRCVGQGAGLRILIYSWISDEPPVNWSEYLFGVDWTLNIFGVFPDIQQQQAVP